MQNEHSFRLGQEELYLCDLKIGSDEILTCLVLCFFFLFLFFN